MNSFKKSLIRFHNFVFVIKCIFPNISGRCDSLRLEVQHGNLCKASTAALIHFSPLSIAFVDMAGL